MIGFQLNEGNDAKHSDELPVASQEGDPSTSSHQLVLPSKSKESCKTLPEKVIIFSQFLEHIHVIEQQVRFIVW